MDYSFQSSIAGRNSRLEKKKSQLTYLEEIRSYDYFYSHTGKVGEKDCWHDILVDCDKKETYLKDVQNRHRHAKDYGKIIASGWGCDVPEGKENKMEEFVEDLESELFVFQLQANNEIYYVLCDADNRSDIMTSSTSEEVGRHGRILYSSMDEDPSESLWDVIERGYFGSMWAGRFDFYGRGIGAVRSGDINKVQDFLEEVGNVDWTDGDGWTMLHHAAHCGDLKMIRFLKDKNANTEVRDSICGRKPIHIAARECCTEAIELLLSGSDSIDDVDKSGWTPLHYAAWKGVSETVTYLISRKASTELRDRCLGKKPVHVAAAEGHIDIVQIFLGDCVVDVDDPEGRSLLYYSTLAGRFEMIKFLIDKGAGVHIANKFDVKPVHTAPHSGHAQVAELLLSHGADIKCRDHSGETPLHRAGDINVVQMLVNKGANLNAVNDQGKTSLDLAMANQNLEMVPYLSQKKF